MTTYDYKVVRVSSTNAEELEPRLDACGRRGFSVVGVAQVQDVALIIFQRGATEGAVDEGTYDPETGAYG